MQVFDYYNGFEGEPEIDIFVVKEECIIDKLSLYYGYFINIVDLIKINQYGFWEGVPLHLQTCTGWYDEELWECKNQKLFLTQLKSIQFNELNNEEKEILSILINTIENSININAKLFFEYS